jgi:hypothetical protein
MRARQGDWIAVWSILIVGSIAAFFGLYGLLAAVGLALRLTLAADTFTRPAWGYLIAAAALHLATGMVCGYTCVRRLDGHPVARWGALSAIMVGATLVITTTWFPHYYFFGM